MKQSFPCLLSVSLLAFVGARAEQAPTNSPEASRNEEIAQLEAAWNSAHLRADANAVDKLCTDDLTVVVPAMAPMSKKAAVGTLRAGRIKFTRYETTDTQIRLYNGDTAIVTGRLQRTRAIGDRIMEDDWRFTKVWVRSSGRWQVAAFHATPNAP